MAVATYFITVTCYGTWLHGDERGSHFRKGTSRSTRYVAPDPVRETEMRRRMTHPAMTLSGPMRRCVRESIATTCEEKKWKLRALNLRTNHFHLVVAATETASKVLNAIKAKATKELRDSALLPADQPIWTSRGHPMTLRTEQEIRDAIQYVLHGQGPDLPEE